MSIRAVVFDIGNVLLEWDPARFYDREIGPDARRALFAAVDLAGMNARVDRGEPFRDTVQAVAERHPDHAGHIALWHDRWLEMASPEIPGSVRLLRALRGAGVPVFALSNFGVETFEIARAHYPFLAEFDRRFLSGHLRVMKPEARIYEILERETGHAPGELLFTDDLPANIAAAEARGWATHLFEGPRGLAARLRTEGLLGETETA